VLVLVLLPSFLPKLPLAKLLSVSADSRPKQSDLRGVSSFKLQTDSETRPSLQQRKKSDINDAVPQNRTRKRTGINHNPSCSSF